MMFGLSPIVRTWKLLYRETTPLEAVIQELMVTEHYRLAALSRMDDAVASVTCYEKRIARLRSYVNEATKDALSASQWPSLNIHVSVQQQTNYLGETPYDEFHTKH